MGDTENRGLVRTGIAGLDEILMGGVHRTNNILVEGAPGTGKTTFGLEFIYAGAAHFEEPGAIISFELEPTKLLRDASGFGWDLQKQIDEGRIRIISTSPEVLLNELRAEDSVLCSELRAMNARRLLIDGLTPLRLEAEAKDLPYREALHLMVENFTQMGITTVVTRENEEQSGAAHERYVFDTILDLEQRVIRRVASRTLTVVKSRGQDFIGGAHTVRIEPDQGLRVYRRAQSRPKLVGEQPTSTERLSTGSKEIDQLLDGGLYVGSTTLVAGISGTGKTVLATQLLVSAAATGHKGLIVTLDEHPRQLLRNASTLGFDLQALIDEEKLFMLYDSPHELELDVHFDRIATLIEKHNVDVVVFDSVGAYETAHPNEASGFLYVLSGFLKNRLATTYFNYESSELMGVSHISHELKGSPLVDNIVLLSYVEISTQLRRAISVPKARGTRNVQTTREFVIEQGGIRLIEEDEHLEAEAGRVPQLPFSSYYGLLARSPEKRSPTTDAAVAQGKDPQAFMDSSE